VSGTVDEGRCPSCQRPVTAAAGPCPNPWRHVGDPPPEDLPSWWALVLAAAAAFVLMMCFIVVVAVTGDPRAGS
jgi:hypothetical protein